MDYRTPRQIGTSTALGLWISRRPRWPVRLLAKRTGPLDLAFTAGTSILPARAETERAHHDVASARFLPGQHRAAAGVRCVAEWLDGPTLTAETGAGPCPFAEHLPGQGLREPGDIKYLEPGNRRCRIAPVLPAGRPERLFGRDHVDRPVPLCDDGHKRSDIRVVGVLVGSGLQQLFRFFEASCRERVFRSGKGVSEPPGPLGFGGFRVFHLLLPAAFGQQPFQIDLGGQMLGLRSLLLDDPVSRHDDPARDVENPLSLGPCLVGEGCPQESLGFLAHLPGTLAGSFRLTLPGAQPVVALEVAQGDGSRLLVLMGDGGERHGGRFEFGQQTGEIDGGIDRCRGGGGFVIDRSRGSGPVIDRGARRVRTLVKVEHLGKFGEAPQDDCLSHDLLSLHSIDITNSGVDSGDVLGCLGLVGVGCQRIRPERRDVRRRGLPRREFDRNQHGRAALLRGDADARLDEHGQEFIRREDAAVHLQCQPDQREAASVGTLAGLIAACQLPVGRDDLLNHDGDLRVP